MAPATLNGSIVVVALTAVGLSLFFSLLAWDGLRRRHVLIPFFFGVGSHAVRGIPAVLLGSAALVVGAGLLFLVVLIARAIARQCGGSLPCIGQLIHSANVAGWLALAICGTNFAFWLSVGNPCKRFLAYGAWYHQDKVAREVNTRLRMEGQPTLADSRLYELEDSVLHVMHEHRWLDTEWDGEQSQMVSLPSQAQHEETILRELGLETHKAERLAVRVISERFSADVETVRRKSRLARALTWRMQLVKLIMFGENRV